MVFGALALNLKKQTMESLIELKDPNANQVQLKISDCMTLSENALVQHSSRALLWNTLASHSCRILRLTLL